jgi:protocatechuate 3,4-dioxygenase beta subunit
MWHQKLNITFILCVVFSFLNCYGQERIQKKIGGPCEGCEAIFEYGNKKLGPADTLPDFQNNKPKLKITGTVFEKDGKTATGNVIIYIYHTNRKGIYPTKGNETGWAKRHGYLRGWVKTGKDGKYTFYTFRPAAYPNGREPEHIHITIKEPEKNEYYLDEYVFADDPLLTDKERTGSDNRGGSGIVAPKVEDGMLTVRRNIILGLNIPNYE